MRSHYVYGGMELGLADVTDLTFNSVLISCQVMLQKLGVALVMVPYRGDEV